MGLNVTAADLALTKPTVFTAKEVVEFICLDVEENAQYEAINLKCKVLSGENTDRRFVIRLSMKKEHEIQRRKLATFALAFYSEDEITKGDTPIARLVGRRFTAVAQVPREYQGKTYQDFDYFKDLGEGDANDLALKKDIDKPSENPADDIPF